jgi:hypothetical protein
VFGGLKRFILWDFPRASWQYDVMVGVILVFLFCTPRAWFWDQPKIPQANAIAHLPAANGSEVYWIEPELVTPIPDSARLAKLGEILKSKTGRQQVVTRLEPIYDSEKEIKGYMAFAKQ